MSWLCEATRARNASTTLWRFRCVNTSASKPQPTRYRAARCRLNNAYTLYHERISFRTLYAARCSRRSCHRQGPENFPVSAMVLESDPLRNDSSHADVWCCRIPLTHVVHALPRPRCFDYNTGTGALPERSRRVTSGARIRTAVRVPPDPRKVA